MTRSSTRRQQRGFAMAMTVMAWLLFMLLLGLYFNDLLGRQQNPNQDVSSRVAADGAREVLLRRNRAGHYVTSGTINGQPVVFLLDTGATGVAIPASLASKLQLELGPAYRVQTANGVTRAYAALLDTVSVGDIVLTGIQAAVTPGLQTEEVLLGMSFLRQIEFTQRGDTLLLRQYP